MENFRKMFALTCVCLVTFQFVGAIFEFTPEIPVISNRDAELLDSVSSERLKQNIELGVSSITLRERLEENLRLSRITVRNGSISHAQFLETMPNEKARKDNEVANKILKASLYIRNRDCLPNNIDSETCQRYFSNVPLPDSDLKNECHAVITSKRDGHHAYRRLLPARYKDGFYSMYSNPDLPKPREVSVLGLHSILNSIENGNEAEDSTGRNLALIQWTQFIEHDLSKSVVTTMKHGYAIECCNSNQNKLKPRYVHPACAELEGVTKNKYDAISCLNYVRNALAVDSKCNFGPAEQLNQATGYLDLSQLYGFTRKSQRRMRTFQNGYLRFSNGGNDNRHLLPLTDEVNRFCAVLENSTDSCFMAGDTRVNSNPFVTMLYTIFLRSHNQIARKLAQLHPRWSDERLFREAKKANVGIYRAIVFNEWLPVVVGKQIANTINSEDLKKSTDESQYRVSNEFGVAAIRFYYSMMPNVLEQRQLNGNGHHFLLVDTTTNTISPKELFQLKDEFYNPKFLTNPHHFNVAIEAVLNQRAMKMDSSYSESLIKYYLKNNASNGGISGADALAWDIQRGRDHGLQGYVKYLERCERTSIKNWDDLRTYIDAKDIILLQSVYKNVADIDLIVGGISEIPREGSTVGPTFTCILGEQFSNIRKWHYNLENNEFATDDDFYTEAYSASKLLCEMTDLKFVPRNIFMIPSNDNRLVPCADI